MSSSRTNSLFATLFMALMLLTSMAYAQPVPSSTEVGVVSRELEAKPEPAARMGDIITFSDKDARLDNLSDEKLFNLVRVELDGSTVYTQSEIDKLLKDFYGKPTSFRDLNEINNLLTKKYRDDGYVFSRTELSPQKIKDGVVIIRVLEGRIGEVTVEGNFQDRQNLIARLAEKIKTSGPANTKTLERYLLLINDIPGITAKSLLRPSTTQGAGDVVITVEQKKLEGSVSVDNRGSGYLGRTRATLVGAVNSLFSVDDRTTLRGIITRDTDELKFGDLTHERQIGSEGFRIKARLAKTATNPGKELKPLPVEGDSTVADLELLYPILRSRQYNVNLIGGFNALSSETDVSNVNTAKDRVRTLRIGSRFDFSDAFAGINSFDLSLNKGINGLGATNDGLGRSKANGKHDGFRTNLTASRLQDFGHGFSALLSASGQYSSDALLSSEEFSIGGAEFGRAYDAGEITGDRGAAGSLELRYANAIDQTVIQTYEVYAFYDAGRVWNENPAVAESSDASLASAGVGTRFNFNYDFSGYVEVSKPLTREVGAENNEDPRLFMSLTKRF
jgi:hemolysin activation/secretion protein